MAESIYYEPRYLYDPSKPKDSDWDLAVDQGTYQGVQSFSTITEAFEAGHDWCNTTDNNAENLRVFKVTEEMIQ